MPRVVSHCGELGCFQSCDELSCTSTRSIMLRCRLGKGEDNGDDRDERKGEAKVM